MHWGLGCAGAVTNGSMRDLDMMCPQFQCLAATLSPSHAFIQVVDFGKPVDVLGMAVSDGDIVHADYHGAVVIPPAALEKLPAAIDLMARKEKVILEAARQPGFSVARMREAMARPNRPSEPGRNPEAQSRRGRTNASTRGHEGDPENHARRRYCTARHPSARSRVPLGFLHPSCSEFA